MGLFDSLDDPVKSVHRKVTRPIFKKTVKPAGKVALKGLKAYDEAVSTPAYAAAVSAYRGDWDYILNDILFNKPGAGTLRNKKTRERAEEIAASTPGYIRIPGQIVTDPTTYLGGYGALRGLGAAGVKMTPRLVALAAAKDVAGLSGATLPLGLGKGALQFRRARSLGQLNKVDAYTQLLKTRTTADEVDQVRAAVLREDIATLRGAIDVERGGDFSREGIMARFRASIRVPNAKDMRSQYLALAERTDELDGLKITQADYLSQLRAGRALPLVMHRVNAYTEMGGASRIAHQVGAASSFEQATQKIPVLRRVVSGIAPSVRARVGDDPVLQAAITREATLVDFDNTAGMLGDYVSAKFHAAGLAADPRTRMVKVGGETVEIDDLLRNWRKYYGGLNGKQRDAIDAYRAAKDFGEQSLIDLFDSIPESSLTSVKRKELARAVGSLDPDGLEYLPRLGLYVGQNAGDASAFVKGELKPSAWRRVMATAGIPGVTRIGRTALPEGFKKLPSASRQFGAVQSIERERVAATEASRVIFTADPGHIIKNYLASVGHIVTDEGVIRPMLNRLGKTPNEIVSAEHDLQIGSLQSGLNRLGDVRRTLHAIALPRTGVTVGTADKLRRLAADEGLEEEVRVSAQAMLGPVDEYLVATNAEKITKGEAGRALASTGRKLEKETRGVEARRAGVEAQERAKQFTGAEAPRPTREERVAQLREEANAIQDQLTFSEKMQLQKMGIDPQAIDDPDAIQAIREQAPEIAAKLDDFFTRVEAARKAVPDASEVNVVNRVKTTLDAVRSEARVRRAEVDAVIGAARSTLKEIKEGKLRALEAGTMFDLRQTNVPSLSGHWFDKAQAEEISKLFGRGDSDSVLRMAAGYQAIATTMMAGADMSVSFLQSLALLPQNPFAWGKAMGIGLASLVHKDIYWRYLEGVAGSVDPTSGKSVMELLERGKLSLGGTEIFAPQEMLRAVGTQKGEAGARFIANAPWNRVFTIQRNVASIELFRSQVGLETAIAGRALDDDELKAVGRQVDLATGAVSNAKLGIQPDQALAERLIGRFGVQWFRSQTGRLVQAFNGGMDGRVARRLLFHQLGAMAALYYAAARGLNQDVNFDPSDRDFMTLKVGASRVGFGGIFHSVIRTVAETSQAVAEGDEDKLTRIRDGQNPILNFWRNGAPVLGGLIADQVVGVNADTTYQKSITDPTQILPFSVQSAIDEDLQQASLLDRALAGGSSGLGLRQSPQTVTDLWRETSQQAAIEAGFPDWDSVPKAQQLKMIRENAELTEADARRQEWFKRGKATPLDVAFDQTGKSRDAMNDTLAIQWAKVEAGQLSKSEWRQMYADWSARHAYFSENVFSSLPEEDAKELNKDAKTVQDRFAQRYQAIQPVDSDEDGIISEQDWKVWRSERDKFWTANPEALKHRAYITVEYPTRVWKDPMMADADRERRVAAEGYDEYVSIPKYRGLSLDDGAVLDALISAKDRAAKEIRTALEERGVNTDRVRIPANIAWKYAIEQMRGGGFQFDEHRAKLLRLAVAAEKDEKVKLKIINPERVNYLRKNPAVLEWYPSSLRDTGLSDKILTRLGLLTEPSGETLQERGATLAGVI